MSGYLHKTMAERAQENGSAAPAAESAVSPLLAGLRTGRWLDEQEFPPIEYAVPGIIPEGFTLLVGPPKIGKSWFVLAAGLAIASGGVVLSSIAVDPRPVLYLALEDGDRRLQDRCRVLLHGERIPPEFHYMTRVEPGQVVATIEAWLEVHARRGAHVILDTLGKVMPPALVGESSYQRDYRVGSALQRVITDQRGGSLVVNHHDRKAESDDFVDAVSGTNGLAGAADTIVVLNRKRHEVEGILKVTGRDVSEGEYALRFDAGALWRLEGGDLETAEAKAAAVRATEGLGDLAARIIRYVSDNPSGVTPSQVAEEFDELDAKTAGVYLGRAVKAGRLTKTQRGVYTPVGSVGSVETDPLESNTPNTHNTLLRGLSGGS